MPFWSGERNKMGTSIFGTGVSALNSAQLGLATAEHNISNLNTPGFTRQQAVQQARMPQFTGVGYIGQGVDVSTVKRIYSEFLNRQVLQEEGLSAQLDSHYAQIKQIDNMLADANSGMAPSIQEFFSSVNNAASAPESQAARQALINNANSLASRFQSINQRLVDLNNGVNSQITNSVTNINSYAKQISTLNQNIVVAHAANGQPPNDLMDQRDELVNQLNREIKASVVKQSDGSYSVFVGNGQSLVVGAQAFSMKSVLSPADPSKADIAYVNQDGKIITLQQSSLNGGTLGGLLAFRDKTLTNTQNDLGRVAMSISGTFNEQHKMGQDLNGDLGTDFFSKPEPFVISNTTNRGSAALTASVASTGDYSALSGSDYELKFDGGNSYSLTRLSDNKTTKFADGLPQTPVDGLTLSMSPGAMEGDRFTIRPTVNAARDISVAIDDQAKIAIAMPLRTQASLRNTGSGKVGEAAYNAKAGGGVNALQPLGEARAQLPIVISFNNPPTTYNINGKGMVDPADPDNPEKKGYPFTPGEDVSYNGWSVKISGSPAAGDIFTLGNNTNATADGRNGLLLAALQTQNTMNGGTTTYQGAYSQLVSNIGNKTRELEVTSKAQASMVDQTEQTKQSLSGVNMDEEAANLIRYQRAYQAAGKALQIANTMFDTVLSIGR
jgi:flagellar hook-associated protein 1 FlgK